MKNTARNATSAVADAITWNRRKVWGSVGMTHYAEVTIGDNVYRFTLDQPKQYQWVGRGWVNGSFCFYRDSAHARTLKDMKALVAEYVAAARAAELKSGQQ